MKIPAIIKHFKISHYVNPAKPIVLCAIVCVLMTAGAGAQRTKAVKQGARKGIGIAPSASTDVNVTVTATQPGWTISKYLTGMHTVYGNEPDRLWEDPRVAEWMRKAKVGAIRYPGEIDLYLLNKRSAQVRVRLNMDGFKSAGITMDSLVDPGKIVHTSHKLEEPLSFVTLPSLSFNRITCSRESHY